MFDLKKQERLILVILIFALLLGLSIHYYKKSHRKHDIIIGKFSMQYKEELARRKININSAGPSELSGLKGIGPAMALRIVQYRDSNGPFASIEEIEKVKGIGEGLFGKIKDDITVGE
jgi:comEA protein